MGFPEMADPTLGTKAYTSSSMPHSRAPFDCFALSAQAVGLGSRGRGKIWSLLIIVADKRTSSANQKLAITITLCRFMAKVMSLQ